MIVARVRAWIAAAILVFSLAAVAMILPPRAVFAQNSANDSKGAAKEGNETKQKSSTGTQLATSELLRIEQESQMLNQRLAELTQEAERVRQAEQIIGRLPPLIGQAPRICGEANAAKERFFAEVSQIISDAQAIVGDRPGPWVSPPQSSAQLCETADFPTAVLQEINAQLSAMRGAAGQREEVERQLAALEERREEVLGEMASDFAGSTVANDIPLLMLIIFGVGAATLAGVKLFDAEIQRELVTSGQIVQFVTILILLGVILALGISGRLQAETLGTLLGGLAGYVLSQGVGRQAQQQVLNDIKSAAGGSAPPTPARAPAEAAPSIAPQVPTRPAG